MTLALAKPGAAETDMEDAPMEITPTDAAEAMPLSKFSPNVTQWQPPAKEPTTLNPAMAPWHPAPAGRMVSLLNPDETPWHPPDDAGKDVASVASTATTAKPAPAEVTKEAVLVAEEAALAAEAANLAADVDAKPVADVTSPTGFLHKLCRCACQKLLSARTVLAAVAAAMLTAVAAALPMIAPREAPSNTAPAAPDRYQIQAHGKPDTGRGQRKAQAAWPATYVDGKSV